MLLIKVLSRICYAPRYKLLKSLINLIKFCKFISIYIMILISRIFYFLPLPIAIRHITHSLCLRRLYPPSLTNTLLRIFWHIVHFTLKRLYNDAYVFYILDFRNASWCICVWCYSLDVFMIYSEFKRVENLLCKNVLQ